VPSLSSFILTLLEYYAL
jgi:hypothetical protein